VGFLIDLASLLCPPFRLLHIAVWGYRAYAVFDRSKIILIIFGILELIVIIFAVMHVPYVSCTNPSNRKEPAPLLLPIFTVTYEIVSAILTSVRSLQNIKNRGPWRMQQKSLTFLVLRESLIYFGFITSFLILSLIFELQGKPGNFMYRLLNAYTMPLSGLMTARFLLHLREWDQHISNPETIHGISMGVEVTVTSNETQASYHTADNGPIYGISMGVEVAVASNETQASYHTADDGLGNDACGTMYLK